MQLMPKTASMMSQKVGAGMLSSDELTDPHLNILLGFNFYKNWLDLYGGNLAYPIMAYNAGPGNGNKWVRATKNKPLDEFIEDCPFNETRGYVKRVLRSSFIYGQ